MVKIRLKKDHYYCNPHGQFQIIVENDSDYTKVKICDKETHELLYEIDCVNWR